MDFLNKNISWYQAKIGDYDKQYWELSSEQRILKGLEKKPKQKRAECFNSDVIDIDVIRGSAFSKAKPLHSWSFILWNGFFRVMLLPYYFSFWKFHTNTYFGIFLLIHYFSCLVYIALALVYDNRRSFFHHHSVPLIATLLLGLIHAHILSPLSNRKKKATNSKKSDGNYLEPHCTDSMKSSVGSATNERPYKSSRGDTRHNDDLGQELTPKPYPAKKGVNSCGPHLNQVTTVKAATTAMEVEDIKDDINNANNAAGAFCTGQTGSRADLWGCSKLNDVSTPPKYMSKQEEADFKAFMNAKAKPIPDPITYTHNKNVNEPGEPLCGNRKHVSSCAHPSSHVDRHYPNRSLKCYQNESNNFGNINYQQQLKQHDIDECSSGSDEDATRCPNYRVKRGTPVHSIHESVLLGSLNGDVEDMSYENMNGFCENSGFHVTHDASGNLTTRKANVSMDLSAVAMNSGEEAEQDCPTTIATTKQYGQPQVFCLVNEEGVIKVDYQSNVMEMACESDGTERGEANSNESHGNSADNSTSSYSDQMDHNISDDVDMSRDDKGDSFHDEHEDESQFLEKRSLHSSPNMSVYRKSKFLVKQFLHGIEGADLGKTSQATANPVQMRSEEVANAKKHDCFQKMEMCRDSIFNDLGNHDNDDTITKRRKFKQRCKDLFRAKCQIKRQYDGSVGDTVLQHKYNCLHDNSDEDHDEQVDYKIDKSSCISGRLTHLQKPAVDSFSHRESPDVHGQTDLHRSHLSTNSSAVKNQTSPLKVPETETEYDRMISEFDSHDSTSGIEEASPDQTIGQEEETICDPEDPFLLWYREIHDVGVASIYNPVTVDTVGCYSWEDNQLKKAELTLLDIGWSIIQCVDMQLEDPFYLLIATYGILVLALIPFLYIIAMNFNQMKLWFEFLTSVIPSDLWLLQDILISQRNIWTNMPEGFLIDCFGIFVRISTYLIASIFLSVTEKTFQQRLQYAKHFCCITSLRRARKYHIPHFRLNKVKNIKQWLTLRSYLKRRGPQRSVDSIITVTFYLFFGLASLVCFRMLTSKNSMLSSQLYWELIGICVYLSVFLVRFITISTKISKKYCNVSILMTEQINLYLRIEKKPRKRDELMLACNALKLAENLLKEVDGPFRVCGWSINPLVYNVLKVVILSACSAVISDYFGFKLKLYKIKINPANW